MRNVISLSGFGVALLLATSHLTPVAAAPDTTPRTALGDANNPDDFLRDPPKPARVKGKFSVASMGDLMNARPQSQVDDPELQKVLQLIRGTDVGIGNQEGMAFDFKGYAGVAGEGGLHGEPTDAADYPLMGIHMVQLANNHSTDWGDEGVLASAKLLDEAGVAHGGAGRTLEEARAAGVYTTPKGSIGLVATASTFKEYAGAVDPFNGYPGRPGIAALRTRSIHLVSEEQMKDIRAAAAALSSSRREGSRADAREVRIGDETFRVSDTPGHIHYDMDLYDHAGLLKAVREAKDKTDLVVFAIHAHESPTGVDDDTPEPPDFLVKLFHNAADAGADVIMGGGPHSMRGIEIYKGKPILYGLGLFFFKPQLGGPTNNARKYPDNGIPRPPDPRPGNPDNWYDSVLAMSDFDGAKLKQVRLYPIDLRNDNGPSRGLPHLAQGDKGKRILADIQKMSVPFGTKIAVEGNAEYPMGVIRIP